VHLSLIGFVFPTLHSVVDSFLALFLLFFRFEHSCSCCLFVDLCSSNSIFVVGMFSTFMVTQF
jgi:hypothetical protein